MCTEGSTGFRTISWSSYFPRGFRVLADRSLGLPRPHTAAVPRCRHSRREHLGLWACKVPLS
jgi:hypothetical protein